MFTLFVCHYISATTISQSTTLSATTPASEIEGFTTTAGTQTSHGYVPHQT